LTKILPWLIVQIVPFNLCLSVAEEMPDECVWDLAIDGLLLLMLMMEMAMMSGCVCLVLMD